MTDKKKDIDHLLDAPIIDPEDESHGVELVQKKKREYGTEIDPKKRKINKPGEYEWTKFGDYLDKANISPNLTK